jgi:AraC-like DNA-binding protein
MATLRDAPQLMESTATRCDITSISGAPRASRYRVTVRRLRPDSRGNAITAMNPVPFFSIDGPLFTPPPYGAIRGDHYFRGFVPMIRRLGGNCDEIFERHDINQAGAEDPEYPLSCATGVAMLEYCSKRFKDDLFGLHLADYQEPDVYGCLTNLARAAPNLRLAIESLVEYIPVVHMPGVGVEFLSTHKTTELRFRADAYIGLADQASVHSLLLLVKFFETLAGRDFRPSYVSSIADISSKNSQFIEERFHCKVYARLPTNSIGFQTSYLDRPLKTFNKLVFGLLSSYLSQVKNAAKLELVDRVQAFVRNEVSSGGCSQKRCAAKLETTPRTLHRHLIESGLKFSALVEKERRRFAERALVKTDCSLREIAYSLGYSDQSTFGRAFKRWTKMSPQSFRDSRKSER